MPLSALNALMAITSVLANASSAVQSSPTASSAAVHQLAPVVLKDTPFPPLDHVHQKPTAPPRTVTLVRPTAPLYVPHAPLVSLLTQIPSATLSAQTECSSSMAPAAAPTDRIRLKTQADVWLVLIIDV